MTPQIDVYNFQNQLDLEELKNELRTIGISSTVQSPYLRIQGIQNCLLLTGYFDKQQFLKCMSVYDKKEHLTLEGIVKLVRIMKIDL